jgi:outer membrane protein TolC
MKREKINYSSRFIILPAVVFLLVQTAVAQTKNEFSLKQTVDFGLKNAVQVKNALLDIKIQHQTNREITAAAFPQLNGTISSSHFFNIAVTTLPNFISPSTYQVLIDEGVKDGNGNAIKTPAGGFGNIAAQFGVPWTASGGLDLTQLLFDGQVFVGLQARDAAMQLASRTADVTAEQIKANINKIYYQLVVGQKQLGSIDANIERFNKLLNDTKEIYKNGFAEKLDVDKVSVQLNNLTTEREKVISQLTQGNAGLKFLINMPQKDELVLTDTLSEDDLKNNILEDAYSYTDRKEIQLLTVANKLNGYNIKRYELSRIPTVAAFASYSKNAQRTKFNFFDKGDWFTTSLAGIKISVPIFDGFARRSKIESARLSYQKTTNTLQQAKESMDYEVAISRTKMKTALLTVDNQKQNIKLAEDVFSTTKKKYEQGLGSNQEIYTAQTELKVAQNNYYSALYDAITAKIDYLKAVGKL